MTSEVKAKGKELLEQGRSVAKSAYEAASETAADEGLTPDQLKEKLEHVAGDATEAAKSTAQEEGLGQKSKTKTSESSSSASSTTAQDDIGKKKGSSTGPQTPSL